MGRIKARILQNDPLVWTCYLISFLSLFLVVATLLNVDNQAPLVIVYVDGVVGIISLGMAIWVQRSSTMLPRRIFATAITLACLVALSAERQEPSSSLIISTIPVLIFILAEQSLWPIWLDPLFLTATALLSRLTTISAAFVGFHILIFLTIGGMTMYVRQNVERALAAERRAEMEFQRAENESRIKKMFGSIAHELNNAASGMAALMPIVSEQGESNSFLTRSLNAIQWNMLDIQRIANQLRLLAKTGDITLAKAVFPLRPLIDVMVGEAENWVAQHGRDITISVGCDSELTIYGNEFWIGLYLRTLLKNCLEAIDQSGGVGAISVCAEQFAGVAITISDTGPGFPPDRLGQLNDRDSGIGTNKATGTGIGIPFMKMVAFLHDARIVFANKNGRGASVELHFQGNEP